MAGKNMVRDVEFYGYRGYMNRYDPFLAVAIWYGEDVAPLLVVKFYSRDAVEFFATHFAVVVNDQRVRADCAICDHSPAPAPR